MCILTFFIKVGSVLILVSVALLRGPWSHIKHMMSTERLPFTASYVGSMVLTLYAALGVSYLCYVYTVILIHVCNRLVI